MKILKILAGIAFLAYAVFVAFVFYRFDLINTELNRKKTEAARANRWKRNENENANENETELEKNTAVDSSSDYTATGGN